MVEFSMETADNIVEKFGLYVSCFFKGKFTGFREFEVCFTEICLENNIRVLNYR